MNRNGNGSGERGQAVIVTVMLLLLVSTVVTARGASPAKSDAQMTRALYESKVSATTAESGSEDVTYRVRSAKQYDSTEVLILDGKSATTTVTDDQQTGAKMIKSESSYREAHRLKLVSLVKGDIVSFNYGVQAGNGGFTMANSSSVVGNVYSNGPVTGSGNTVQGSVVSAGPSGLVDDIYATSSVWAHTITDADIDGDAHYQVISGSTVLGTLYPNSPDKPPATFPISDEQLDEWQQVAEAGGVISSPCPYKITVDTTIGPKKINCDLEISNKAKVTLAGMVWVNGNVTVKNSSGIYLDTSLQNKSIALIANKPSDQLTSSKISLENTTTFYNTGTNGSFLFLVSRNKSAEEGGGEIGIELRNTASGPVFLYTNHGKISIGNNTQLKAVTGHTINMSNFAKLFYDDGLESSLFDTGPGGSWNVTSWKEVE